MLKRVQHDGRWAETFSFVIPAKAGIHKPVRVRQEPDGSGYMDSRLRGNDGLGSEGVRAHVSCGLGASKCDRRGSAPLSPGSGDVAFATLERVAPECLPATILCAGIQSGVAANFYRVA